MEDQTNPPKWAKTMMMTPMLVGLVANSWARLEHALVPLSRALLKTPDYKIAKAVRFSCNPVQRRDLINALSHLSNLSEDTKARIKELMIEFDAVRVLRNNIVHGHWAGLTTDGDYVLSVTSSREKLKETLESKELAWIMEVVQRIESLCLSSTELARRVAAEGL